MNSEENINDNQSLEVLSSAIERGYLVNSNWDSSNLFELEFDLTDLYFAPNDKLKVPSTELSIKFINPKSISILSKIVNDNKEKLIEFLFTKERGGLDCMQNYFTFTDQNLQNKIINESKSVFTIYGYTPIEQEFNKEKYRLVFWAEDYGFAISGNEIELSHNSEKVELNKIHEMNKTWNVYWEKYCSQMDTKYPLPKDSSFEWRYYYGL